MAAKRAGKQAEGRRPNIVFVFADDQRHDTIHALGNDCIKTPNLDKLVKRGTAFTQAHIPGGTVGAVCMPSRAMLNSGKTLFHLKDHGASIPEDHITLGECLRSQGYRTFGTGKWHNGTESYARSFTDGENIFFGGMWDHWNVPICSFSPNGKYESKIPFTPDFTANGKHVMVTGERIVTGVHSTELFTKSAINFIENYDSEDPFFIYLSYLAPHDPRTMPEEFRTMYDPKKIELPPNFQPVPMVNTGWSRGRDESLEPYPRDPDKIRQHIADYYAMISHIDHWFGKLVASLEKSGQLDNTIIIYCADNGLAVGQHGLMGKQSVYEHSIRVPLIMSGPGISSGKLNDKYVYLLDIYPTLCELCGLNTPSSVEGISFAKLLSDDSAKIRENLFFAFQGRARGVKNSRFKLIEYRTDDLKMTQLFDLKTDPWEQYNFFDIDGYEEITRELRALLREYSTAWDDQANDTGKVFWGLHKQYERESGAVLPKPKVRDYAKHIGVVPYL
ncbi:sulfatase-like hydrolase/transferase [Treponema sp. OttesenSCG-928-L16]|nr:sulfatase-like hydrolase/transferase [Treponema sp. OttesenSCG-928-L16]